MSGTLANGLRLSFGTLTALPVAPPTRVDGAVARAAMIATPLPGLLLGGLAVAVAGLGRAAGAPSLVTAAALLGSLALATRGLHLDGLADTADGMSASYDKDRALAVMRSGDVGPSGVTALVLVLLLQAGAVAAVVEVGPWWRGAVAVALAVVAGRSVLVLVCAGPWPPARAGGLGAAVAGSVPVAAAATVTVAVLLGVTAVGLPLGLSWYGPPSAAVLGWLAAWVMVRHVARRLGGTTGDVLGAAVETATTTALVVLACAG